MRHEAGPAHLLDVVPERSKKPLKTRPSQRDQACRRWVEVVAMDGFTGFKNAAGEEVPEARAVMDPFHVVSLTLAQLDECRRRVQHETAGWRGRKGNPLYQARRTLRTDAGMLTDYPGPAPHPARTNTKGRSRSAFRPTTTGPAYGPSIGPRPQPSDVRTPRRPPRRARSC